MEQAVANGLANNSYRRAATINNPTVGKDVETCTVMNWVL
jgi:hypothetical protein